MKKTRILTVTAMLSAMAIVLQLLGKLIPPVGGFLEIELSDLPAIIGTLSMGPLCGVMIELVKNILHILVPGSEGIVGEFANFCVNGVYVLVLGLVYTGHKTKGRAVFGFFLATVLYSVTAAFINYFIMLPFYMPAAEAAFKFDLVLTVITPFNIIKGTVLALITLLIYKKLSPIIKGTAR